MNEGNSDGKDAMGDEHPQRHQNFDHEGKGNRKPLECVGKVMGIPSRWERKALRLIGSLFLRNSHRLEREEGEQRGVGVRNMLEVVCVREEGVGCCGLRGECYLPHSDNAMQLDPT